MFMLYDHQGVWNSCSHEIEIQTNKKLTAKKEKVKKEINTTAARPRTFETLLGGGSMLM